jgi:alpha-tubulin suppressor-like RCC1 family protein
VVAAGRNHTCAVLGDGVLRCFGAGVLGQLGGGFEANSSLPRDATGFAGAVAAGGDVTAVQDSMFGDATTWGSNTFLQLGDTTDDIATPFRSAAGSAQFRWNIALSDHGCATDFLGGTLGCWGRNDRGQVGNGSAGDPVAIVASASGAGLVHGIAAGRLHTCAIVTDGSVQCWGDNTAGQLGGAIGTALLSTHRLDIGVFDAVQVSGSGDTTCARTGDGTVTCWGANDRGQAGQGGTSATPVLPGLVGGAAPLGGVVDLAVGAKHACAVVAGGTVKCWGANDQGQLGLGTTVDSAVPASVPGHANVRRIVAGNAHTCAMLADGTARCWGGNDAGQLGDGTVLGRAVPAAVAAFP